jgi:F-type H+-transporting ATPase subunit a
MISDTAGLKAKPYFAFIFSLFMFVLFCNMFGMIPYTFTVTSHIIVTFVLAAFIFIGVTIIGFMKHGFGYLKTICTKWGSCSAASTDCSYRNNFLLK